MAEDANGSARQVKDLPVQNRVQNKTLKDAARDERLNSEQRRKLGKIIEEEYRQYGVSHDYHTIRGMAREIKEGKL